MASDTVRPLEPPGHWSAARAAMVLAGPVLVGLGLLGRFLANLWTDYLWYSDLGHADTWERMLSARLTLVLGATAFVFAVVSVSVVVAERLAPPSLAFSRRDPLIVVRAFTALHPNVARTVLAGVAALLLGPAAGSSWEQWTLFRNGRAGDRPSYAMFGQSIGFYLFRLPFLRSLTAWLFAVSIVVLIVTVLMLVLNGGIMIDDAAVIVSTAARRQLSVLLAIAFAVRGLGFWYSRFALTFSNHNRFDGASYVDLKVRAPGYVAMVIITAICVVLLLANLSRATWQLPAAVAIAWALVGVLVLGIMPAVRQRVAVSNEAAKEKASILRSIDATRAAFELNDVESSTMDVEEEGSATAAELSASAASLRNLRLWDVTVDAAPAIFSNLQKIYPNFHITHVDADRATTDGKVASRLVAVREMDPNNTGSSTSWVNRRLMYTHGYGVVTAGPGATVDGEPQFQARGLPPTGSPKLTQPRVYFGEETSGYVVVATKTKEIDFGGTANRAAPAYTGKAGIKVGSLLRRLAFSVRFGDLNLLLSSSVTPSSRILWTRTITERAHRIAPFFRYDSDPLPVIYNGRLLWVLEGYTVSDSFPNSDRSTAPATRSGSLAGGVSYARNSVRVVIDAYTGDTEFFRNPTNDPIVAAWDRAFPTLFSPLALDERYPGLRDLVRYPRDLFDLRSALWGRYHTDQTDLFYNDGDRWVLSPSTTSIRKEPDIGSAVTGTGVALPVTITPSGLAEAQYVVSDPAATGTQTFLAQQVLVSRQGRPEDQRLRAIVTAPSTGRDYGRLRALLPPDQNFDGPSSAAADLQSSPEISDKETNLGRGGSEVISGEVQVVRVGGALLYLRPLYVQGGNTQKPLLRFVEVRYRGKTGFAPTLQGALAQVVTTGTALPDLSGSGSASTPATGSSGSSGSSGASGTSGASGSAADRSTVVALLADAQRAYDEAQAALAKGDLGEYQAKVDEMGAAVEKATALATPTTTTTTPRTATTTADTAAGA